MRLSCGVLGQLRAHVPFTRQWPSDSGDQEAVADLRRGLGAGEGRCWAAKKAAEQQAMRAMRLVLFWVEGVRGGSQSKASG